MLLIFFSPKFKMGETIEFLLAETYNHIYLGQWELARACALNLIKNDLSKEDRTKLATTLQSISKDPYLASSAWPSLPCASYVSLLSYHLMADLGLDDGKELKNWIDFNILLEMVLGSPEKILKEMSLLLEEVAETEKQLVASRPNFEVTNESISALKKAFKENPSQVSLILHKLCLPNQMKFSLNPAVLNIYYQSLLNSLKSAHKSRIYQVLSLLPPQVPIDKELEEMFLSVLELCPSGVLDLDSVYISLLGRPSPLLLRDFCRMEDSQLAARGLKSSSDNPFCHRGALLWSIRYDVHFLQDLMDSSMCSILEGEWETVREGVPRELRGLFLLLSWEKCQDDVLARNVTAALKTWKEPAENPVLEYAFRKFRLNLSLTEMCIANYTQMDPDIEVESQTRKILTRLQTQSLLRVLHSVFNLKNIPTERLESMLCQSQEYVQESEGEDVLTDAATYSGYVVLMSILEAIHLSGECKQTDLCTAERDLSTGVSASVTQEAAYSELVVKRLESARQKLKNLFPLSFRIEILENIFSMLFLMAKNLADLSEHSYDSDQGHEGESQLLDSSSSSNRPPQFKISTMKLMDQVNRLSENLTGGHMSSKSTESSGSSGLQPQAFLCNELVTRDLLSLLKDAVLEAKAEVYKWMGEQEASQESLRKCCSGVPAEDLPERTSRLLNFVNEALWRYEVVQRDIFRKKHKPNLLLQSQYSTSSSESTDKETKRSRKRKKRKHGNSLHKDESLAESSIVQCMLSSPEALLRYSLWNANLEQALQVIQLFKLQSSEEAKELTLINELKQICSKILAYDKVKENLTGKNLSLSDTKATSGASSVSFIKSAVSSGLKTSDVYMTIHQELSSLKILQVMDIAGRVQHPELLQGSENIYSIFLIDLACVSDISLGMTSSLLDSADKSWTCSDSKDVSRSQRKVVRGNSPILHTINSLIKEFLWFFNENNFRDTMRSLFWPVTENFNTLSQMLPCYAGNLNHAQFKDDVNVWDSVSSLIEEFSALLEKGERAEFVAKDVARENKLHMAYKRLSRTLRQLHDWSSVRISSVAIQYFDYLSKLFIHLRQVTTAALECKNQNKSASQAIYTSDFSILKESPVELLKKMILQTGVTPDKIETFAVRMKVDLVRVLSQACLPRVPLTREIASVDKWLRSSCETQTKGFPKYVLNVAGRKDWARHPDLVARELLRDLISMLQETALVNDSPGILRAEELLSLSRHSQIGSWMEECSELASVDLDLLKTREERLAFFANVTNVAWIYALLVQASVWKSQEKEETKSPDYSDSNEGVTVDFSQELLLSPNKLERFTALKVLGFAIGQLGPISLFDLRYQLLRADLPIPRFLDAPPFLKLFGYKNPVWEKYAPPLETRLLFVLIEGLLHSPKLQVLYSEDVDHTLEKAMKDYFDYAIRINLENDSVSLPQLLEWYALDFSKDDESCLDRASYEGLINLLSTLVRSPLSESFQKLLSEDSAYNFTENIDSSGKKQLPFTLEFWNSPSTLGILLDYPEVQVQQPIVEETSLMDPRPMIIGYLKGKCSILTDLYEIMISDSPSQYLLELNLNVPVFNLLKFYNSLHVQSDASKSWFASALGPTPDRKYFSQQIEFCFSANMWQQALLYIDLFLEFHSKSEHNYALARQLILGHVSSLNMNDIASEPSKYALCISDPSLRAEAVLQNVHKWSEHSAIRAMKYCLSDSRIADFPDAHQTLKTKFRELMLYQKIVDASEMYGSSEAKDCVYVFNNWQEVADCSVWDQSRIFDFLDSCEKYDLAVEWLELNTINRQQKIVALSMNLLWYLLQDPPDEKALKILDALESSECLQLCDIVLPKLLSIEAKLCLVQYLVHSVPLENKQLYCNKLLSLKMLSALKSPAREIYADSVSHPYLLLEQMLMNIELKDAERALKAVEEDLLSLGEIAPVIKKNNINQLVEDYASKALEVHFLDALLDTSSSSTLVLSIEDSIVGDEPFVMPVRVPTKEEWVPDAKIHRCQVCKEEHFNMFSRRHHCRRCGRVVCGNCSQHALVVEGYGNVKVRVCEDCYNLMTGSISVTSSSFDKRYRVLSSMQSSPRNSPFQENRRRSSVHQPFRWVLSSDQEQNASVRNEFAYDQAPSISLCFSILKLHSDAKRCGQFMLNLCDRLLAKIKPRRSGKIPVEMDYGLIISMIKSLLVNAKVTCHQVHDSEGEALAELYFQHLDVVKLLVNANCKHLLPREAFTSSDPARKLRDKLLEEERMSLALEVSTKFNLDKTGVWSSWGLFCIRAGNLPAARNKFQQCLKVIKDKNDPKQESPLLNKILDVLENSKHVGTEKAAAIYKSLSYLKNIEKGTNWHKNESPALDDVIKMECLYYLNSYGTHISTVKFYQRNNLTSEGLNYIINKKCDPEIFIEGLFVPKLKKVELGSLKHDLKVHDSTLSAWWSYLLATCRYLERLKYLNVLYEMQIFMEDYARAAKSSINFFLAPASNYRVLFDRNRHLYDAKVHFQHYLGDSQERNSTQKSKNLIMSTKEVEKYIEIISLQEEVMRFFQHCLSQINSLIETPSDSPPTLFGNSQKKFQVALMVILNAVKIDEGFELAVKVIQTFGLDASSVLCAAGRELVRLEQKSQIPHFLACVKCFFSKMIKVDQVILECIGEIYKQRDEVEDIIKMLTSETNKINAYLMCDKLKSAYLLAIKVRSALDVRRVLVAAEHTGQQAIQQICRKWLESNTDSKLAS